MILTVDCRELVVGRVTGIGRFLLGVLGEIAEHRPQLRTVAVVDPATTSLSVASHVTAAHLPRRPTFYADQVVLPRLLRRVRATTFFSPYYKAPLRAPCPTVVSVHDLIPLTFPAYAHGWGRGVALAFRAWAAFLARRAVAVITDSEYSKVDILRELRLPASRVHVVPIAVRDEFRPDAPIEAIRQVRQRYHLPDAYLLAVGNFLPHKNLTRLVEAYAALPPPLRTGTGLVLAGTPTGHGSVRPVDPRKLRQPGVILPGFIAPADLPLLYAGAIALVCPSLVEGFGLPVLEAMACGTPVVCARAGALPEVAGEAALYADPRDRADIARALERILTDAPLRSELRARGLAQARRFDPCKTTARLVDLLEAIAAGRGES